MIHRLAATHSTTPQACRDPMACDNPTGCHRAIVPWLAMIQRLAAIQWPAWPGHKGRLSRGWRSEASGGVTSSVRASICVEMFLC